MSASEFAFLALGLALGVASGAALLEVIRSRPPAPREVRVTVAADAVPVRTTTLSADPFAEGTAGPAPFGPGDRRQLDRAVTLPAPVAALDALRHDGTDVLATGGAVAPLAPRGGFVATGRPPASGPLANDARPLVGIAVRPERHGRSDGLWDTLPVAQVRAAVVLGVGADGGTIESADAGGRHSPEWPDASDEARVALLTAVADQEASHPFATAEGAERSKPGPPGSGAADRAQAADAGPCGELRAIAEDRCAVAARARSGATTARDTLREAQRAYDDHLTRAEEAEAAADPRAVQRAKETAQHTFRIAREHAPDRDALDLAARDWLDEVNRINGAAREGAASAAREHAAANALVTVIERLTVEADAARIAAESAEEACLAARQAVADCQERAATTPPIPIGAPSRPAWSPGTRYPEEAPGLSADEPALAPGDREARILRILRGDREALVRTVDELAGDDPAERRRWQLQLTGLVDALTAQAIDAGAVDVDAEHHFWGPFTQAQCRDIVQALASLGYRYDGLAGFADGRIPSQRDLSLAVGYAGLDPMRIRIWPTEAEMPALYADASVAADEYLADAAGALTLGELVALLGPRAEGLTDLWNDWGRIRPRLLATD